MGMHDLMLFSNVVEARHLNVSNPCSMMLSKDQTPRCKTLNVIDRRQNTLSLGSQIEFPGCPIRVTCDCPHLCDSRWYDIVDGCQRRVNLETCGHPS